MKTCPICHAKSFDDAEVCYGCLHRFDGESRNGDALASASVNGPMGASPEHMDNCEQASDAKHMECVSHEIPITPDDASVAASMSQQSEVESPAKSAANRGGGVNAVKDENAAGLLFERAPAISIVVDSVLDPKGAVRWRCTVVPQSAHVEEAIV